MKRKQTIRQIGQSLIRRFLWAMDIHPSTWIAPTALIDRTYPRGIHIDQDCIIGAEAVILTHDLTRGLYLDTRIGAGTVIGQRAIILPGISIGKDCIVQPGALVNRNMPDFHIAEGNPAISVPRQA